MNKCTEVPLMAKLTRRLRVGMKEEGPAPEELRRYDESQQRIARLRAERLRRAKAPPPDPRKEEEEFPPSLADGADVPPDPNDRKRRAPEALEAKITKLTIRDAPEEHADVAERVFEFVGCRMYDGGYCEGECVESPHRWCSGWKRRSIEA